MEKFANIIIIGGPIAAGKTSLVGALPFISVPELDPNDELQKVLLEKLYEGDMIASQVFQLDMMLSRFDKYKNVANSKKMHVFDRMIFEDKIFAFMLFGHLDNVWNYYNSIWEDKVRELIEEVGKPKLYILLTISWTTFKQRIFERNRSIEVHNFEKNKKYFKELLNNYEKFMVDLLKKYDISYVLIDTNNINKIEVVDKVTKILKEKGII